MAEPTLLTVAHNYPLPEVHAMTAFYGGKKCVITNNFQSVHWAHMLDASLEPPSDGIERMLERNLFEIRHPRNIAEVRENLLPLSPTQHDLMNQRPPQLTMFLHEDVVARTLSYERDLQDWRIAELTAGRSDPGRPPYREVFGPIDTVTQHRLHAARSLLPFHRHGDKLYTAQDCPGAGDPPSGLSFPVINTILSIPFSLLHNLPRLTAMPPLSTFQHNLSIMALEIEKLWWWDPSPKMVEESLVIRAKNIANGQQSDIRNSKPDPIHHASRLSTIYRTRIPSVSFGTFDGVPQNRYARATELPDDQALLDTTPPMSLVADGLMLTSGRGEGKEMHLGLKPIIADSTSSEPASIWDTPTFDSLEDSEDDLEGLETSTHPRPLSTDIKSWYVYVVTSCSRAETLSPPPLVPSPFQGGDLGGMRTNDILMIEGLLHPRIFVEFFDLSASRFSWS